MKAWMHPLRWCCLAGLLACLACTGEQFAGEGSVEISLSGGEALRSGFPYKEGEFNHTFIDGWTAKFSRFVVVLGDVQFSRPSTGEVVGKWDGPVIIDMMSETIQNGASAGFAVLGEVKALPAVRLDVGFSLRKASADTKATNVDEAIATEIRNNQWSLLLEGEAKKDDKTVSFRFGLALPTSYSKCTNGKDNTLGVAVEANKKTGVFIYLHAVHLFWDSLGSTTARLRFDPMAAVAGDDGVVSSEDLAKQDLTQLQDASGSPLVDAKGKPVLYDDSGFLPPGKTNLLEFLKFSLRDSIHFNGVGLCTTRPDQ